MMQIKTKIIYMYIYTCVTVPIYDLYSEHRSWILIPDDLTRKEICHITSFIVTSIFSSFMYRSLVFFWFSLSLRLAKSSFVKSTPLHSSRKSFRNLAEKNIIFFYFFMNWLFSKGAIIITLNKIFCLTKDRNRLQFCLSVNCNSFWPINRLLVSKYAYFVICYISR